MPISLEQWRASLGYVGVLMKCKRSPRVWGAGRFLLVAVASEGSWVVTKSLGTKNFSGGKLRSLSCSIHCLYYCMHCQECGLQLNKVVNSYTDQTFLVIAINEFKFVR